MWPFKKKDSGLTSVSPEDDGYTDAELGDLFNQINSSFGTIGEALMNQARLNAKIIEALDKANIKIDVSTGPTRH